jgi:hypothetical protein
VVQKPFLFILMRFFEMKFYQNRFEIARHHISLAEGKKVKFSRYKPLQALGVQGG